MTRSLRSLVARTAGGIAALAIASATFADTVDVRFSGVVDSRYGPAHPFEDAPWRRGYPIDRAGFRVDVNGVEVGLPAGEVPTFFVIYRDPDGANNVRLSHEVASW